VVGESPSPEEPVRQWCAFELIRAYGIPVMALEFEHPVKVGSKNYRIDIVVKREGRPWVVIECKEPSFKKSADAINQAISYADAQTIKAEFVVYTNGHHWMARRRVRGEWVEIADLPPRALTDDPQRSLRDLLECVSEVAPLIYKLDERLENRDAECFLFAMQNFFHAGNLLTEITTKKLYHGLDRLLRLLSVRDAHPNYQWEKLNHAWQEWELYRKASGVGQSFGPPDEGDHFAMQLSRIHSEVESMVDGAPKPYSADVLLLRLTVTLLKYAETCARKNKQFLEIPQQVHQALRDFLNFALTVQLNTQLPDNIDTDTAQDIKCFCCERWESLMKGIRPS
jgi:hypothetical protein